MYCIAQQLIIIIIIIIVIIIIIIIIIIYMYKDTVECERIVVWTVKDNYWVSTFRYATPSTQYLNLLEKVFSSDVNPAATPWMAEGWATGWGHWTGSHET